MRKPNLFIIGAAKCGTTSLHDFLAGRPDVFMSEPKEPGFFVPELDYYPSDEDWYLGLFRGAEYAKFAGESSTHYTKLPIYQGVPARIAAFAPDARLIYLMRDPVKRAISQYWHHLRKFEENRPIEKAVREGVHYVAYSDYRMQLEAYLKHFEPGQIRVLVFEEVINKPQEVLSSLLGWLGVSPGGSLFLPRSNAMPEELMKVRGKGFLRKFSESRFWERMAPMVPKPLRTLGTDLAVERAEVSPDDVRRAEDYLRPILREKTLALSELLGRSFPSWKTTSGDD